MADEEVYNGDDLAYIQQGLQARPRAADGPRIDPALQDKIAQMRARMRQLAPSDTAPVVTAEPAIENVTDVQWTELVVKDEPASAPAVQAAIQTEPANDEPAGPQTEPAVKDESGVQTESLVDAPASVPVVQRDVNFSLLDRALANHGLETIDDSEDSDDDTSDDSDDSGSDDSDSDDSDDEDERRALTRQEREEILQAADDEGDETPVLRTKNEGDDVVQVPDFVLPPDERIEALGRVSSVVGTDCVVMGMPQPQTKVLDVGSLLCFADRSNLGYVADTFGPVILPMFTVRFRSVEELRAAGVTVGRDVFWVPAHAVWVFDDTLRVKGSDASNLHDEEVGQDEVEFSDDEAEAEYKRMLKQQRRGASSRGRGRGRGGQMQRPPRPLNDLEAIAQSQGLQYDPRAQRLVSQDAPLPHGNTPPYGSHDSLPYGSYDRPHDSRPYDRPPAQRQFYVPDDATR